MHDVVVTIAVGGLLIGFAAMMLRWHFRSWREQQADPELSDRERWHYRLQFRRRLQISGLLLLLGILLIVGDLVVPWGRQNPAAFLGFTIYWTIALAILAWVMLLATLDWWSIRTHARASMAGLQRKQRELEQEAERLRRQHRNGRDPHKPV